MAELLAPDDAALAQAVRRLREGRLVAMPTETVYGLAGDADNPEAVRRIFAAKGRPADHPVIVHLHSVSQLDDWAADVPDTARALAAAFWPGPLTLVLPRRPRALDVVTGGQDTVGLRCPAHPVAQRLLQAFGGALAAPSANRYGQVSPTRAAHVLQEFAGQDVLVLDGGDSPLGIESTIVGFVQGRPRVLRPGSITAAQIEAVAGESPAASTGSAGGTSPASAAAAAVPRVPGSVARHYAPRTPTRLLPLDELRRELPAALAAGRRIGVLSRSAQRAGDATDAKLRWRQMPAEPEAYAQQLYAALRELDATQGDQIWIEALPQGEEWLALRDRLSRASTS